MVRVEASDDGRTYRPVGEAPMPIWRLHTNPPVIVDVDATSAKFFRVSMPAPMRVVELALAVAPPLADPGAKAGWGRYVNAGQTPGASDTALHPGADLYLPRVLHAASRPPQQ